MESFHALLEVIHTLNGPGGCPWDLKQTFPSLRKFLLEEAHEALEAIDLDENGAIIEELGDLFFIILFYGKVAERENRFELKDILDAVRIKMIRRHPHVFGEGSAKTPEEVLENWERIKKEEKAKRTSPFEGIPPTLPSLQKGQKVLKRLKKEGIDPDLKGETSSEKLASEILKIAERANEEGVDLEQAVSKALLSMQVEMGSLSSN